MRNRLMRLSIIVFFGIAGALAQDQLLKDKLVGKTFVICNFYSEPLLRYDASGNIRHHAQTGDWTTAYFKIEKESVSSSGLELKGRRLALGYDKKKDGLVFFSLEPLSIKVEDLLAGSLNEQKIDELAHQLFVDLKSEPDRVPDYWRDLVSGNVAIDIDEKGHKSYRLKNMARAPQPLPSDAAFVAANSPQGVPIYRVGGKVTRPELLNKRDPEYSELARRLRFEATTVLLLVLGETGEIESIAVIRPAGLGLDESAVQAVKSWTFKPATLDGKPVKVTVSVEVSYSLHY